MFSNVCRICVTQLSDPVDIVPLFELHENILFYRICNAIQFSIAPDDQLGRNICKSCAENVLKFYNFHLMYKKSNLKLREMLTDQTTDSLDTSKLNVDVHNREVVVGDGIESVVTKGPIRDNKEDNVERMSKSVKNRSHPRSQRMSGKISRSAENKLKPIRIATKLAKKRIVASARKSLKLERNEKAQTLAIPGGSRGRFEVDFTNVIDYNITNIADFQKFLDDKHNGKTRNVGNEFTFEQQDMKLFVNCGGNFSKKGLKFYIKNFLKNKKLRDWIHVVANKSDSYQLNYININL